MNEVPQPTPKKKSPGEIVFIVVGSLILFQTLFSAGSKTHGFTRGGEAADGGRIEIMLEIQDALLSMSSMLSTDLAGVFSSQTKDNQMIKAVFDSTKQQAEKENPPEEETLTKLVILAGELNSPTKKKYFDQLCKLEDQDAKDSAEALSIAYALKEPAHVIPKSEVVKSEPAKSEASSSSIKLGSKEDLETAANRAPKEAQSAPAKAEVSKSDAPKTDAQKRAFISEHLPSGWYTQHAILHWLKRSNSHSAIEQQESDMQSHSMHYLLNFVIIIAVGAVSGFVGLIVILIQLFLLAREITPARERFMIAAEASYGWLNVYEVFLFWLLTQVVVGLFGGPALKAAGDKVLLTALLTMTVYTAGNAPGLFYAWWFGFKPNAISFVEGIKFRWRVNRLGPVRMVLIGIAAWSACIPIVLVSYAIATHFLNSHGSSNPILGKVIEAAHTNDSLATLVFYFTLGVLAPFCEEALFRGFLYSALRRNLPVFPSLVLCALPFALAHLDPGGMLPLFALGFIFAFVTEKTKSIIPAIVAHGLWNSGTFTLVLLLFGG
jgi:membrane protease YdiL (CAAX protease family)